MEIRNLRGRRAPRPSVTCRGPRADPRAVEVMNQEPSSVTDVAERGLRTRARDETNKVKAGRLDRR
jgi:hypothetical protein